MLFPIALIALQALNALALAPRGGMCSMNPETKAPGLI